ncbi:DUF3025 domain-containing protein [Undibacterium sp. Jales W-56]|uniref:DUF3025 domain-containing protein n=1 Tax=Undibacterium sp. Jales W-56 TaxID=2897325 RepID=UPI0021D361E9|nr:DUF3025 domain-containing protein [Undibacterium sp. Jales W-56]MCU6434793.1 DUF3025 domain-containing protein [Undibacterium sp. Jales W-56]
MIPEASIRFYAGIDWSHAWYAAVRPAALALLAAPDWRAHLNQSAQAQSLQNQHQQTISFVAQACLPEGVAYEIFINESGQVPTRENLHDFFNALVWLTFPRIKRQLNAMQAAQIALHGIGKSRGPARDAATIFDENAALLVVENSDQGDALIAALRAHEWQQAFIRQRALFGQRAEVWVFGHALMEKLVNPYKAITAHSFVVRAEAHFFAAGEDQKRSWLDREVAMRLNEGSLSTADYTPLPVLGIPGWWQHQDDEFYQDTKVFRSKRQG